MERKTPHQHQLAYEPPVTIYMGRDKVESACVTSKTARLFFIH
jgi:hypothetical protein